MKKTFLVSLSTVGPVGYLKGSGTFATIITLPFVYVLREATWIEYGCFMAAMLIVGLIATQRALRIFRQDHDPAEIVIDEVIGCLFTFWGRVITPLSLVIGFCLFRFFDIYKPCGISKFELFRGSWGITLDDIL